MSSSTSSETLFMPNESGRTTVPRGRSRGLSHDLLGQAVRRLRILALLYAFTFFMAAFFPMLLFAADRQRMREDWTNWLPGVVAIAVALLVALLTWNRRISLPMVMTLGLVFEVASSYGIAFAEFLDPGRTSMHGFMGLSWVAVWVSVFTVVVPTQPRRTALAALASVSAVPVIVAFAIATGRATYVPDPGQFFFWIVFPYLLVVLMAYVGAHIVYALGKEVTRARELGSYQLVERLGQGGMGEVWRARHRLLARPAAIKLIRLSSATSAPPTADALERFEREAQVTAGLRSPHTVDLFDFGVTDDGTFYYVMELLEGFDLETLVKRFGPVRAERAIFLLRQVCHSLAEAEAHGLVHRDIKPANIFVCRYGTDHDFVKVLDFGIVKAAQDPMATSLAQTQDNILRGTPAFIAPEQALGNPVDGRADVYATGCVAYWLLTGQLVFDADSPIKVILDHAHTAPQPPSARAEQPIPDALDQLVMACLAKSPADRPQTAKELSRRLAEIDGIAAWTEERARDWWDTHEPGGGLVGRVPP